MKRWLDLGEDREKDNNISSSSHASSLTFLLGVTLRVLEECHDPYIHTHIQASDCSGRVRESNTIIEQIATFLSYCFIVLLRKSMKMWHPCAYY